MKRIISCLLVFVLALTPCIFTCASDINSEAAENTTGSGVSAGQKGKETDGEDGTGTETKEGEQINSAAPDTADENEETLLSERKTEECGQIDVSIRSAMILEKDVEFTVSLTNQSPRKIRLLKDSETQAKKEGVTFDNLPAGTYMLTVMSEGFAGYAQEIEVDGWAYAVNLTTGFVSGYEYKEESLHPGVLLIGDVDRNGVIDEADKDRLIEDIDEENYTPESDINGDGKVDIVDLDYFVKGYQISEDISSSVEVRVPAAAVSVQSVDAVSIDGDLSSLLKEEGNVILSRNDGKTIAENTPVSVEFTFPSEDDFVVDGIVVETGQGDSVTSALISVTYMEEGQEKTVPIPLEEGINFLLENDSVNIEKTPGGAICIYLGSQIAVKKVSLRITGLANNNNLVEISKVEFVNGMENRIPEPDMDIPENLSVKAENKKFTAAWDGCKNVTGYEVEIVHEEERQVQSVKGNSLTVTSFNEGKLVNNEEYKVRVQSVNGTWRSGYCEPVTVVPKTDKKPDAPSGLKTTGQYKAVSAAWKKMSDTDSYNVYYKESGTEEFEKIEGITANSYTISNLKNKTEYDVYVTGVNELGEGRPSLTSTAKTTNPDPAQMPKYKRINAAEDGEVSEHIISAKAVNGQMQDSPRDTQSGTAWGTVDNNPLSYHYDGTWDSGGYNLLTKAHGLIYEFDQPYQMESFALQETAPQDPGYGYIQVRYWDENGSEKYLGKVSILKKTDTQKRVYYFVQFPKVITVTKIQFGLARSIAVGTNTVSEVYFYRYDSLEDEIMALYTDDLHMVLREDVTQETIDALRERINMVDVVSGEYHPDRDKLEKELKTAEDILHAKLTEPLYIHNGITTGDVNRGFGGLNAWQPLGITAEAGEEITIYVGHNSKKTGESTNLQLVATQYHAESGAMYQIANPPKKAALVIGKNEITIPRIGSIKAEAGGALYIQYTGRDANDNYAVRVSGGSRVPTLNLYRTADETERLERAKNYLTELQSYVANLNSRHEEVHGELYNYDEKNCILGASDIMLDTMLLSLPAKQIWEGTGNGSIEERAQRLVDSMDAMEAMMHLFYQHKGLNSGAEDVKDRYPSGHLNIRYQRMFPGAFMYAAGNHIGIEWNETKGMMGGSPVQSDENGRYESGRYFGWGIAHEIGHCINQGCYAAAEITNNYFSVLAQAKDTNDTVRFKYDEVYKKVTSGTKGRASSVFTQLGLYWQLHLAYDSGYNYKTYDDYEEQLENLFFARVDTYARNPSRAPSPGGVALTLSGGTEQVLMRLSCAAAEKDILEFFDRWGMTPDEGTKAYAAQFEKETRAIYYVNDDSRVYRQTHEGSVLDAEGTVEAVGDGTAASINEKNPNQVDFILDSKNIPEDDVLGYEIIRGTISGGETKEETVAFVTREKAEQGVFSDTVTTMNNRVVYYKVMVIDKYLNRSAQKELEPLKIQHDGSIDKTGWTMRTEGLEATSKGLQEEDTDDSCVPEKALPIKAAADNDKSTTYTGRAGENAEIILEFNKALTVTGFKYTVSEGTPIKDYSIYVYNEEGAWTEVSAGVFKETQTQTVWFAGGDGRNIASYKTMAVKLVIKKQSGKEIAVSELDVLGITGDNIDFRRTDDKTAVIGRLGSDFVYGDKKEDVIPAESIVFTGSYKGNPAYNVVILYDAAGNIVGGVDKEGGLNAYQIILADVPESGNIQEVSDGTWIYWIKPEDQTGFLTEGKVRAELYRVDDAGTNEGQRLVSDTYFESVPEELPEIQLSGGAAER